MRMIIKISLNHSSQQEIATTAETVRKELSKYERAEVEFKEKEKHLKQKEKKLNKTVSSVRN